VLGGLAQLTIVRNITMINPNISFRNRTRPGSRDLCLYCGKMNQKMIRLTWDDNMGIRGCATCIARLRGMTDTVKREKILELRSKGLSFTEIGEIVGVSRQRAHQIVKASR
jgi:hypothetical protein